MDRLSELQRRLPRDIFEYHIKILGIGKPDQSRNSLHRLLGLPQQFLRTADPGLVQVLTDGGLHTLPEDPPPDTRCSSPASQRSGWVRDPNPHTTVRSGEPLETPADQCAVYAVPDCSGRFSGKHQKIWRPNVWISFSVAQKLSETSGFNAGSCFSISETIRWKAKSWSWKRSSRILS